MCKDIIAEVLTLPYFGEEAPIPFTFETLRGDSRMTVVMGENASGKSFFRQVLAGHLNGLEKREKRIIEVLGVGMHHRTAEGVMRGLVYGGSDKDNSTGALSINVIKGAFRTADSRDHEVWLILDEPDVGLSNGYARAMGEMLGKFTADLGEQVKGVIVVSHSRSLIEQLMTSHPAHLLRLGDKLPPMQWVNGEDAYRSVDDLLDLPKRNRELRPKLTKIKQERAAAYREGSKF